jgi:hypothetical protein
MFLLAVSCCSHEPCIVPPPMETNEQNSIAVGIAAQLASLPVGGSLSTTFSNTVHNTYDKLADNDKSLYLFLLAIECYLKEGRVGQDIARQMAQMVQTKWTEKETVGTKDLRPTLSRVDSRSPKLAPRIHSVMKKVGLE